MKTIEDFNSELEPLLAELKQVQDTYARKINSGDCKTKTDIKKIDSIKIKIDRVRFYISYLELNPNEEFITNEISRLEKTINYHISKYVPIESKNYFESNNVENTGLDLEVMTEKDFEKRKKSHYKEFEEFMGIPKLRKQVRGLRHILN